MRRAIVIVALLFIVAMGQVAVGQFGDISISTDFDGSGEGSVYNLSSFSSSSGSWTDNSSSSSPEPSPQFYQQVRDFEAERLEQQRKIDELRREEAAERQARAESARQALATLNQLNAMLGADLNAAHQYSIRYQLTQLAPQFHQQLSRYRSTMRSQIEDLSASIDRIVVPSPVQHYGEVMIFGTGVSSADAARWQKEGLTDPFDGVRYDRILGFGRHGFVQDFPRAALDHLLASVNTLTQPDMDAIHGVRGAVIDRLVAHSNGALAAIVMIQRGLIHVKRFDILGGDGALMSQDELHELHDRFGVEINVYSTKADVVPLIPVGWKIRQLTEELQNYLPSMQNSTDDSDAVTGLTAPRQSAGSGVSYHLLSTLYSSERIVENHEYATYHAIIRRCGTGELCIAGPR